MLDNWLKLIVILTVSVLSAGAVQSDDTCEAKLGAGFKYFGAFRALVKAKKLGIPDIEKAIASRAPYDPFATAMPTPEISAAIRVMKAHVDDPLVKSSWPAIQRALTVLLEDERGEADVQRQAERATEKVLSPHEISSFDYSDERDLAWTVLPDGEVGIARLQRANGRGVGIEVITPRGDILWRHTLPNPAPAAADWEMGWHQSKNGPLWLYIAGASEDQFFASNKIYRLQWGSGKDFEEIPDAAGGLWTPEYFRSLDGQYMIFASTNTAQIDRDVTGPSVKTLAEIHILPTKQAATVDDQGKIYTRVTGITKDAGRSIVYKLSNGKIFSVSSDGRESEVVAKNSDVARVKIDLPLFKHQVLAAEDDDGTLLVGISGSDSQGRKHLVVLAPHKNQKPIFDQIIEGDVPVPYLHWFRGARQEPLLAVVGLDNIQIGDVRAGTLTRFSREPGFSDWFSAGDQTYYYTNFHGKVRIHALIKETRR